jgi:adenylosuccinate lyase
MAIPAVKNTFVLWWQRDISSSSNETAFTPGLLKEYDTATNVDYR